MQSKTTTKMKSTILCRIWFMIYGICIDLQGGEWTAELSY